MFQILLLWRVRLHQRRFHRLLKLQFFSFTIMCFLLSDRQTLLSSFFHLFLFRSSAAHIFLKLIIGLILSTILMLQISCIGQSVCSHRIFNVIIVIAASTIVTIQKRTVIFDSWNSWSGFVNFTVHPGSTRLIEVRK